MCKEHYQSEDEELEELLSSAYWYKGRIWTYEFETKGEDIIYETREHH